MSAAEMPDGLERDRAGKVILRSVQDAATWNAHQMSRDEAIRELAWLEEQTDQPQVRCLLIAALRSRLGLA